MLQGVQSFVQPMIVSLELGGSWGPVMSSFPGLLSPSGRSSDQSGSCFEGDKGLCLRTRCNLCKVVAGFAPHSVFQPSSPSHAEVWLYLLSPWLLLVSAPPSVKKGGKGERLVQSFQSSERRAGAKLFQAVQYLLDCPWAWKLSFIFGVLLVKLCKLAGSCTCSECLRLPPAPAQPLHRLSLLLPMDQRGMW